MTPSLRRTARSVLFLSLLALVSCSRNTSPTSTLAPGDLAASAIKAAVSPTVAVAGGLTLSPATVAGGTNSTATLTVSGTQATQARAFITVSNPDIASVPGQIDLNPGVTSATFTVRTRTVLAATDVVVSVALNGVTSTATLHITTGAAPPPPPPAGVTVTAVALVPTAVIGGATSTGTVTLSGAAPAAGAAVSLSSANTAVATVPATVTVAAGQTSATFTVTTSPVAAATPVAISAALNATTRSATLTVNPAPINLTSLTLAPVSVLGPNSASGAVTISRAAPAGGVAVTLASSSAAAKVPASVTVAAGATTATFAVSTSIVTVATGATITATLNATSGTATLTINPPDPCQSVTGLGGTLTVVTASVPQFRATRLRVDLVGDVPGNWINAMGACAVSAAPAVTFPSGTATITFTGTNTSVTATGGPLSFVNLAPPVPAEPGVVLALDAAGNMLEVIWPALAGLAPGPPTVRLNLAARNPAAAAGAAVDATLVFTVRAPDGSLATFTATAANMVIPPLK